MKLVCPECKNNVDLSGYPAVAAGQIVECGMCGITLEVLSVNGETVMADVVDEGK